MSSFIYKVVWFAALRNAMRVVVTQFKITLFRDVSALTPAASVVIKQVPRHRRGAVSVPRDEQFDH